MSRGANVRSPADPKRRFFAVGIVLVSAAVILRPYSLPALDWAREHWLNPVALTAGAGIATAVRPLIIRWLDRRGRDQADYEKHSALEVSAGGRAAARDEPSVTRLHGIVEDLRYLIGKLERAVSEPTAVPEVQREDLELSGGPVEEFRRTVRQLEDALRLLDAADRLATDISHRADAALHHRREAEAFKQDVVAYASRLRRRLASLEEVCSDTDGSRADGQTGGAVNSSKCEAAHTVASDVLARIDNLLREEAANLERLRSQIAEAVTERAEPGGLPARPSPGVGPADAGNRPSASADRAGGRPTRPAARTPPPIPARKRKPRSGSRRSRADRG